MSDELKLNATLAYADSDAADESLQIVDLLASSSAKKYVKAKQSIGITEEALILGECTTPGWLFLRNTDAANFVNLKVATSGSIFAKLLAGEFCLLRLGSAAQAPFLIADTAPVTVEYIVVAT